MPPEQRFLDKTRPLWPLAFRTASGDTSPPVQRTVEENPHEPAQSCPSINRRAFSDVYPRPGPEPRAHCHTSTHAACHCHALCHCHRRARCHCHRRARCHCHRHARCHCHRHARCHCHRHARCHCHRRARCHHTCGYEREPRTDEGPDGQDADHDE